MYFERLNEQNVEQYIAYLKLAMQQEPDMMTVEEIDEEDKEHGRHRGHPHRLRSPDEDQEGKSDLKQRQPDVLAEFEHIVQTVALDGK